MLADYGWIVVVESRAKMKKQKKMLRVQKSKKKKMFSDVTSKRIKNKFDSRLMSTHMKIYRELSALRYNV